MTRLIRRLRRTRPPAVTPCPDCGHVDPHRPNGCRAEGCDCQSPESPQ